MGKPSLPEPALLFVGALYREEEYLLMARGRLRKLFGDIALESLPLQWGYSGYYKKELGSPVQRSFLFFGKRMTPDTLSDIKLMTNDIEGQLSERGRRNINLDPGYLTSHNVVLASTKDYSHRIYVGKGIYAEVTLVFRDGRYGPHLFTYPDYASDPYIEIFAQARKLLRRTYGAS